MKRKGKTKAEITLSMKERRWKTYQRFQEFERRHTISDDNKCGASEKQVEHMPKLYRQVERFKIRRELPKLQAKKRTTSLAVLIQMKDMEVERPGMSIGQLAPTSFDITITFNQ